MPACLRIGSAASPAKSTPWTPMTTLSSTNLLAQFADDSGVTSVLQMIAFNGWALIPPSSSLMYLTPSSKPDRTSFNEICPPSKLCHPTSTGLLVGSALLAAADEAAVVGEDAEFWSFLFPLSPQPATVSAVAAK